MYRLRYIYMAGERHVVMVMGYGSGHGLGWQMHARTHSPTGQYIHVHMVLAWMRGHARVCWGGEVYMLHAHMLSHQHMRSNNLSEQQRNKQTTKNRVRAGQNY
jgi:hypothetical protein